MGLLENIIKKNKAKNLGLTLEQYDGFLCANAQGITIDEYKRYLSSFFTKYSIEQFSTLLQLEKMGFSLLECERYIVSLANKIQVDDYADFLEAEKIGLTIEQYAVYASSIKNKMSAVDYVGFLKAQKFGITLGKYIQYLKLYKNEMSIEEYDAYLMAQDNGMDYEHYIEYLGKYKDIYTLERYIEFDKARSLGMTLEEYDLRIEASKFGMSLEEYQDHMNAEKLHMTDEDNAEPVVERTVSTNIPAGVLYQPGFEPEEIKARLDRLFEKLDSTYPDKKIVGLYMNHKKWGETITKLYRLLGYPDNISFLSAYGYIVGASGRPGSDPMEVINELKRRYADGATCTKISEIIAENSDLALKLKNLQNRADKFFGMPLKEYFVQEGILVGKTEDHCCDEFEALKSRYCSAPFIGTVNDLKAENLDINWNAIYKYYAQSDTTDTFKAFLIKEGIIVKQHISLADRLVKVTKELKKRYPSGKKFVGTLSKLKLENSDLSLSNINAWTMMVYNLNAQEYLIQQGIMEDTKSIEDKLVAVTETLKQRYSSGEQKVYFITDLRKQNPDLPINSIGKWSKKVFDQNATEYLINQGILSEYERAEYSYIKSEDEIATEIAASVEPIYYKPKTYYVEEIKVDGEETKDWKIREYLAGNSSEIFIEDYHGNKSEIIIPVEINGKKVAGLESFAFNECKAKTVKIPGYFNTIPDGFAFHNENITTVIIGEGVTTIEDGVFFCTSNLENVMVSKSVNMVEGHTAFTSTKWYDKQNDYAIVGTVLIHFNGSGTILNVPHGIITIANKVAECKDVRKVIIPDTVTTLCESAFYGYGNENIQEFVFTDSINEIGFQAFGVNKWTESFDNKPIIINNQLYQVKNSESKVVIPEGITKICDRAFKQNKNLMAVYFPSTLKEIGKEAFSQCKNLSSIKWSEGIERLKTECFKSCSNLTMVNIPDSLIEIGRSAFNHCTKLTEVKLGKSVEIIGEEAFAGCNMLSNFQMNDRLKLILSEAFKECTALRTIKLPETLTEIGNGTFSECESIDNVIIPRGVTKINTSVFSNCYLLKSIKLHEGIIEIAESAFENCTRLTEMVTPAVVGPRAFAGCKALEKIIFASGIKKIDRNVLYNCSALKEIIIPEGVEVIDNNAFYGCVALKIIKLPSTLKIIGKSAFTSCTCLSNVCIPNNVKIIDNNAFEGCTALEEVAMAEDSIIGLNAFKGTPYIRKAYGEFFIKNGVLLKYLGKEKNVVIPDNVRIIEEDAFAEAYHVESITIPDAVTIIADRIVGYIQNAGYGPKPKLKKVVIGNGVTSIGKQAFCNCVDLTYVSFGAAISYIGCQAFAGCKNLKSIDLSMTSITTIDHDAFKGCCNVKKFALPENIETIERNAFSGIPLGIIKLPKSVKRVDRSAFDCALELIVYDSIDTEADWANEWKYDKHNGSVNSPLACAMLGVPELYRECQGNTEWRSYHITVLSTDTDEIRYRIFCDSNERDAYRAMMFSGWGKHASFTFDDYDEYFLKTRSQLGRTEMAFCRVQYPEGVSVAHLANYEAFLERCLYIERSAKRTAEMIANDDEVERLQILDRLHAIDNHNIAWIRELMEIKKAEKCIAYLNERY